MTVRDTERVQRQLSLVPKRLTLVKFRKKIVVSVKTLPRNEMLFWTVMTRVVMCSLCILLLFHVTVLMLTSIHIIAYSWVV